MGIKEQIVAYNAAGTRVSHVPSAQQTYPAKDQKTWDATFKVSLETAITSAKSGGASGSSSSSPSPSPSPNPSPSPSPTPTAAATTTLAPGTARGACKAFGFIEMTTAALTLALFLAMVY